MSVSPPIQLSLAGNGKLVILTPETVRKAFFQFTKVNPEYTGREKYKLEYPCFEQTSIYYKKHNQIYDYYKDNKKTHRSNYYRDKRDYQQRDATILDTLHRSYLDPTLSYLHPQDIQRVERQINKYILNYGLALVKDEGKIREGYINCHQLGKNRYKVKYIMRYGMFFILELILRETMMKMRDVDLFIQDTETYDFHLVLMILIDFLLISLISFKKNKYLMSFIYLIMISLIFL